MKAERGLGSAVRVVCEVERNGREGGRGKKGKGHECERERRGRHRGIPRGDSVRHVWILKVREVNGSKCSRVGRESRSARSLGLTNTVGGG